MRTIKIGVGIVAAIVFTWVGYFAIDTLLNASQRRNTSSAISAAIEVHWAQQEFRKRHGKYGTLSELAAENLIDHSLSDGRDSGFTLTVEKSEDTFLIRARPEKDGGGTSFNIDTNGNYEIQD